MSVHMCIIMPNLYLHELLFVNLRTSCLRHHYAEIRLMFGAKQQLVNNTLSCI